MDKKTIGNVIKVMAGTGNVRYLWEHVSYFEKAVPGEIAPFIDLACPGDIGRYAYQECHNFSAWIRLYTELISNKAEAWLEHKDDLANLQLLQGRLNQNKSDKEFEAWLKESNPKPDDLEQYKHLHLIPDCELTFKRFPEFLAKRTGIIKRKLEELLCTKN